MKININIKPEDIRWRHNISETSMTSVEDNVERWNLMRAITMSALIRQLKFYMEGSPSWDSHAGINLQIVNHLIRSQSKSRK